MDNKQRAYIFGNPKYADALAGIVAYILSVSVVFDVDEDELIKEINVHIKDMLHQADKDGIRQKAERKKEVFNEVWEKIFGE